MAVVGALAAAAPAHAFDLTAHGARPSLAVDDEGTAHVVWSEDVTGAASILHYCRVPRGTASCEVHQTFVPPEPEARYNTDTAGPRVVVTGPGDVTILTFRYPNVITVNSQGVVDPDCYDKFPLPSTECFGTSSKTWMYRSTDGGRTFGEAHIFSHAEPSGEAAVIPAAPAPGGGTRPLIATISDTVTGGTFLAAAPPDGYTRTAANVGAEGRDRAYEGTVSALDGSTPITAFHDLTPTIYARVWSGQGSIDDADTWLPAQTVDVGESPLLASGPSGTHLLYKATGSGPAQYVIRRWDGSAFGPPAAVSDGGPLGASRDVDIAEDGSGTVHVAWRRPDFGSGPDQLRYRTSPDGRTFSATRLLATAEGMAHVEIGAAPDGGGWAVWASAFLGDGTVSLVPLGGVALTPPPPAPVDADRDGAPAGTDCNDARADIRPGATDVPGDGVDQDCSGADAMARSATKVRARLVVRGRVTRVRRLTVSGLRDGAVIVVRCRGRGCPFARRQVRVRAGLRTANLTTVVNRKRGRGRKARRVVARLRPGARLQVFVSTPNAIGSVTTLTMRAGRAPRRASGCLAAGSTRVVACP